jgi:predicted alpha/beta-fold hydrolase
VRHAQDPEMVKKFKIDHDIDINEYIGLKRPSMFKYDEIITIKMFGYRNKDEYYDRASCCWRIPYIKVPTLFMAAIDDPLIGKSGLD